MPFEPVSPLGGFTGLAEPREPERFTDVNPETRPFQETPSVMDAAFRTENTVGSSVASEEVRYTRAAQGEFSAPVKIDPDYDPWADIVDTKYETYADKFALAGNRDHANAIKADIDRETKDRDTIAKSGWTGIGASMAAGVLDLPIFLPGGNLVRTAKGGVSLLRTAGSTAAYGTAAAIASETVLHGSQQLRTGEESAMVIGGSTVLAGLLGAGFGKLFSRADQAAFAARVEKDFTIPGHGEPDHYTLGGVQADVSIAKAPLIEHELNSYFNDVVGIDELSPHARAALDKLTPEERHALFRIKSSSEGLYGTSSGDQGANDLLDADTIAQISADHAATASSGHAASKKLAKVAGEAEAARTQKATSVADIIRQTAEEILPPQVRVQVADKIDITEGGMFSRAREPEFDLDTPGGGRTAQIGDTEITYGVDKSGLVELSMIKTPEAKRGAGSARSALRQFLEEADAKGLRVGLTADPMDKATTKAKLVKFYKSMGFVANKGNKRDFSTKLEFLREPKPPSAAKFSVRGDKEFTHQQDIFRAAWANTASDFESVIADSLESSRLQRFADGTKERAVFEDLVVNMQDVVKAVDAGDRAAAVKALEAGIAKSQQLDKLVDSPSARLWTQRLRSAARKHLMPQSEAPKFSIKAYHASPHEFDKFDLSKLGTGEGNQDFGHGLYLAESEAVSGVDGQYYKKFLDSHGTAHSYEVSIDAEHKQLLDWDKPLSGQSDHVKQFFKDNPPRPFYRHDLSLMPIEERTGESLLASLADSPAEASDMLRKAGIPGIRYLDGGSRDAGEGTRNIVMFDDKLVKITKKNGEPVTAAERKAAVDEMFAPKVPDEASDPKYGLRGFYSPAIRALEGISQVKGTGEQFWKQITKVGGVRKDELDWMGLEEFLKDKPSVTKAEVLDFMKAHQVTLDEKVFGGEAVGSISRSPISAEKLRQLLRQDADEIPDDAYANIEVLRLGDRQVFIATSPSDVREAHWVFDVGDDIADVLPQMASSRAQAVHMAEGMLREGVEGQPKFSGHKVPGGENYRELLIRLPELGELKTRDMLPGETADIKALQVRLDEAVSQIDKARAERRNTGGAFSITSDLREERDFLKRQIREIEEGTITQRPYESKHFNDQEIVHLRVDDRVGPNGEKIAFGNEFQADNHQQGQLVGYTQESYDAALAKAKERVNELAVAPDSREVREQFLKAQKKLQRISGYGGPAAEMPFKGDLWLELGLKRFLLYAVENGYDAISWARSDQIAKAVGAEAESLKLQYDSKIGKFYDKYTKKWGAKVEQEDLRVPGDIDRSQLPRVSIAQIDERLTAAKGNPNPDMAQVENLEEIRRLMADEELTFSQAVHGWSRQTLEVTFPDFPRLQTGDVNSLLRITPEMRASVMEGQPLSLRGGQGAPVAEGRFDTEKLLITISADALDPVKTLKHESIHALRTMNLFTGKEWGTLEAAARKQGWVESNNVRALYEDLYSGRVDGDKFSMRGDVKPIQGPVSGDMSLPYEPNLRNAKKLPKKSSEHLVYHGTNKALGEFDIGLARAEKALFLSDEYGMANFYANQGKGDARQVVAAYVDGRDLKKINLGREDGSAEYAWDSDNGKRLNAEIEKAKKQGYKGLIIDGMVDASEFDNRQYAIWSKGVLRNAIEDQSLFSIRGEGKASTGPLDPKLENLLIEEAIAEQFSLWRQGAIQVTGTVAKLFQRIKDFLDRIGNALRGQGFQTADDVFASVRGGDVAGRAAPTVAPGLPGGAALASGGARSVGAAAREAVDNTLKPALGLEKIRVDPLIYLQNSKSEKSRTYIQELAETPLAYKKNAKGYETAPLGSEMGEPGAVESRIKMWQAPLAEGVETLDNAFMQYRKGRDAQMFDRMRTTVGDALSKPEKLEWRQFKEQVSWAFRRGDRHAIPEVAQAAKFARDNVFNPLKDRAIDKKMLPEDISVETAESYLNRMYNKEKIIARRPEFKDIVEKKWLDQVEFRNGVTRAQLAPLLKRLDKLQEAAKPKPAAKAGAKAKPVDPAKAEAAAEKAAADKAEMTELQEQIEELVLRYEGKTKAEAESAVKAREKAEIGRDPAAKRLAAADKPIIRAARKIAAQVDKEAGETASLADEIIDRILGTPDGRLPYDAHLNRTTDSNGVTSSARGPLAARTFMIPDELIEDFLENDFEMLMNAYVRTMAPDVELHARFKDVDMKDQLKQIQDEWARINSRATSEKERRSLDAQKNGDIRRLAAIRDRLRGTYKLPDNPDGMLLRAGRVMRSVNYMAMLGGQVASAIPDMGSIVFSHGIMRTFGDGIIPLFRNFSGARMAMGEVKLAGTALDMVLDSRAMNIGEIMDDYGRHSKFERGVQSLTRNFGPVSLMSPWNAALKQTAGLITMSRIIKASDALRRGVVTKPDLERLTASGISPANAKKIAEQFKKHGEKDGGVYLPKTENWDADARAAKEAFRVALVREVDKTIITPGQEKWLWLSSELGKTLGQFKSFSVSANQRLLIAGLQQRDMGTLSGAALMVALGGLVHILKTKAGGRDPGIDWSDNEKTSQFMVNAVDRSGLLGWLMEANAVSEKVTGGQVGLSKLTGRPVSRYASRNAVGSLFGPTFGTMQSIGQVSSSGFTEWKETDTRAARRLIPYQNLFYMRSLFDKAEEGVNSYFGVPKTATRR